MIILTYLVLLFSVVSASEVIEDVVEVAARPRVGTHWPVQPWEIYDFTTGFLIGAYTPMVGRAYNNDCYSAFFKFFGFLMGQSSNFNKALVVNDWMVWTTLAIVMTGNSLYARNAYMACST